MSRPKVIVLGLLSKMPVAGVVWQNLHYLLGFERLGYEAWYVEAHGIYPAKFPVDGPDAGANAAAAYLDRQLRPFDLGDRWAYQALHDDGAVYGISAEELRRLYRDAALIVNLHGGTTPRPEHTETGRLIYLETDPVALQVELAQGLQSTVDFLEPHVAFFTFGERYGLDGCGLPVDGRFDFKPTRQPVVLDLWEGLGPPGDRFTTVGNYRQGNREVTLDGEHYSWSKSREWRKVIDLPARTGRAFELALSKARDTDRQELTEHGWSLREAADISGDPHVYQRYLAGSLGEFTVAKDQNVRLRTGWFSDRSATYLACGRPVITQDTGFDEVLPVGEGLLAWTDADTATAAVQEVATDVARHSRAARDIARECFDAERVLKRLLAEVGL